MKTAQFKQTFKVTKNSTVAEQIGKKRETVEYEINTLESADIPEQNPDHLAVILNSALETFAKKQFAANTFNWDYIPAAADITVSAVYADLTAVNARGGSRILTKESLADFATYYIKVAIEHLGKSEKAASNGAEIIKAKLAPMLGNPKALEVFMLNLTQVAELETFDTSYFPVVESLLEIITSAMESELITADAL